MARSTVEVKYQGGADRRTLSKADVERTGAEVDDDIVFDASNDFTGKIPRETLDWLQSKPQHRDEFIEVKASSETKVEDEEAKTQANDEVKSSDTPKASKKK